MKVLVLACLGLLGVATAAHAGFQRWDVEIEEDPFDNLGKLTMMNLDSIKTGMLIMCDEKSDAIIVRWASSFPYDQAAPPELADLPFSLAFDTGERHDSTADIALLGTGNMGFDTVFRGDEARQILTSFAGARSKIYVKIGNNDPSAFTARGSTAGAERALAYCFTKPPA
ncbi:hypothetical protein [Aurantimonas sp. VKM B-3413]|uniref:hypothetical protein n=1 Tax=Aurantimonas sp. VKM B-3413 TaxID=2779401 RepID=UPI001E633D41|nr:hypothetical protein [Aurantimonas sp. VKM B-3413]MCB8835964.1 hypothetical protein [Aurantimonas sp. VKM B-3413]